MDNYKIAFIHSDKFEHKNLNDGQIVYHGKMIEDSFHVINLLEYARNNFSDVSVFNQLTIRHQPEIISYFLSKLGIIVFLNMTKYDDKNLKKYGRSGMFMMPDELTDKQVESLKQFAETIPNFSVFINYDFNLDTGLLDAKSLHGFDKETPRELIDIYLERYKNKAK